MATTRWNARSAPYNEFAARRLMRIDLPLSQEVCVLGD
jgi:hypothetical protein